MTSLEITSITLDVKLQAHFFFFYYCFSFIIEKLRLGKLVSFEVDVGRCMFTIVLCYFPDSTLNLPYFVCQINEKKTESFEFVGFHVS